ncbi:hypothetical protein JCM10021v2_003611 [Rhodotorula toruloides]
MSTFELWLTPSITLSLILESETPAPSFIRWASSWLLYFRPALLRQALAYELEQRPGQDVVSAGTLRVVDYAFWRNTTGEGGSLYRPADADSLSQSIAVSEGIEVPSLEYDLLSTALERVLRTYAIVDVVQELAETQFPSDGSADGQLKELWSILKPEAELPSMSGKHWQEVGFQNVSPATDFRGVGMLGMQAFLYFARTYRDRAAEIVDEAIGGGESWYPLALASIHMTAFALDLATSRDLQLFLLRAVQTRPETASAASSDALTKDADVDIEPFLRIASDLLLLFHSHWRQGGFTVMQFEQTSKAFQAALRPWIRRGILDGRALGWETWEEARQDTLDMIPQLPYEVIERIVELTLSPNYGEYYVPPKEQPQLARFCLVNSHFLEASRRFLYARLPVTCMLRAHAWHGPTFDKVSTTATMPLSSIKLRNDNFSLESLEYEAVTGPSSNSLDSLDMTFDPWAACNFSHFQHLRVVHLNVVRYKGTFFTVRRPHVLDDIDFVRNLPTSLVRLDFFGFVAPPHLQGFLTDPKHPNLAILGFGLPENYQEMEVELAEWCVAGGYRFERI